LVLLPDGLADGEVEPPAPGPVVVPPLDGALVLGLLDVPDGLEDGLELEPPGVPEPPLVWAATIAGVSAMIPTNSANISFCMSRPPVVGVTLGRLPGVPSLGAISRPPTCGRIAIGVSTGGYRISKARRA